MPADPRTPAFSPDRRQAQEIADLKRRIAALERRSDRLHEEASEPGAVTSVAGRTGDVTIAVADVSGAVSTTDSRLSDTRTPTDGTVTTAKVADAAITDAKLAGSISPSKVLGTALVTTSFPRTIVERSASLSLTANIWTTIPWDVEVRDDADQWDSGTANRITIAATGDYLVTAYAGNWSGSISTSGFRLMRLLKNDNTGEYLSYAGTVGAAASNLILAPATRVIPLVAGDTLRLDVVSNTSGQAITSSVGLRALLGVVKLP